MVGEQAHGSTDFAETIHNVAKKAHFTPLPSVDRTKQQLQNEGTAKRAADRITCSRLLMLKLFRQINEERKHPVNDSDNLLKKYWTLLQLQPKQILGEDYFALLMTTLQNASSDWVVIKIRELCDQLICKGNKLFVVLDEAQSLASSFNHYFVGSQGNPRSILKFFLESWSRQNFIIILSGTGLSLDLVVDEMQSYHAGADEDPWPVYQNLGSFADRKSQSRHIQHHVWPGEQLTEDKAAFMHSAFRYLRGRFVAFLDVEHFLPC